MSSIIEDLIARKIFNNRGEETIEVDVITSSGFGRAAAPAGKSRGKAEVQYYPQGGVEAAIKKVDDLIAPELAGLNADFQEEIDNTLHEIDGTADFKNIGGNTAFAISLATAEAAANSHSLLLYQFLGGLQLNTQTPLNGMGVNVSTNNTSTPMPTSVRLRSLISDSQPQTYADKRRRSSSANPRFRSALICGSCSSAFICGYSSLTSSTTLPNFLTRRW